MLKRTKKEFECCANCYWELNHSLNKNQTDRICTCPDQEHALPIVDKGFSCPYYESCD